MGLEDTDALVVVDDEPGKGIPFAVDEAVAVRIRRFGKAGGFPHGIGPRQHHIPEIRTEDLRLETQDADRDRADLVMAGGQELPVGRIDGDHVPFGGIAHDLGDGAGEDPGVETEQGLLPTLL